MGQEPFTPKDYSLLGPNAREAVEKGLAEATWYQPPVARARMRELLVRRDGPAIRDTLIWFALLGLSGYAMYATWGHWYAVFPVLIYAMLYASVSDSRWHEAGHGTAFKTDWMNEALYEIASFMVFRQSVSWRWSHTRHHSDTVIVGRDPEIASPRPPDLPGIILNLFAVKSIPAEFRRWMLHLVGRVDEAEKEYVPPSEYGKLFRVAWAWAAIYLVVIGLAVYHQTWLPLFFVGIPTLIGSYMVVVYGLTQHAGLAEDVLDHRLNCRTVYMNRVHRFLYWNMNYHLEHHMFPLVPYHNLPALHEEIKAYCPRPYDGIIEAYREIIPALIEQTRNPEHYVVRELPVVANEAEVARTQVLRADGGEEVDAAGRVAVCPVGDLPPGEVLRFDHEEQTYAVYRTVRGDYYATDGICTHGSTHLAEGLVIGELIECPKHNGRFSVVDGSPQRAPVCAALATYPVAEHDGRLWIDLAARGGLGAKDERTVKLRVKSNENVATFIKELVLEPSAEASTKLPNYQPGQYFQLHIPEHATALADLAVSEPYATTWRELGVDRYKAANLRPGWRNYSLATDPARDRELRFNVRIALPPAGVDCLAGAGSTYVHSLSAGDEVTLRGPFGDFLIRDTDREMVYLGGGAGMAPLRSHLSHLFETQGTDRKVSFWYGARSAQEVFYDDYFRSLAAEHSNFDYTLALSEPRPEDEWAGPTGYIHEVAFERYLKDHPDPTAVDFYLCGPPPMVVAVRKLLAELGVADEQISFDDFS